MKKISSIRYIIGILIFTIILGISIHTNAEEKNSWRFEPDGKGYYSTSHNGEDLVFCVELGAPLKNNLLDNLEQFYNNKELFCNYCKDSSWRPAAGNNNSTIGYTTEMEDPELVDYKEHQDVAYALAFETNQEKIQTVIWKSSLDASGGSDKESIIASHTSSSIKYIDDEGLAEEAQAYKKFYEEKEAAGGFNPVDNTNYEKINVISNQEEDTYIIGKFNINYTKGIFKSGNKVVKFGFIEEITLTDQDGEKVEIADLLDANGESIMSRSDYRFPNSEEDFYIKFKSNPDKEITKVSMNAKFKYLDVCQASMFKWTGKIYEWGYTKQMVSPLAPHKKDCTYQPAEYDDDGKLISRAYYSHENCHYSAGTHYYAYYYELKKAPYTSAYDDLERKEAQDLLTVEPIGDEGIYAKPIWKETQLHGEDEIEWIYLTMELGGKVFLDKPGEKETSLTKVNGMYDEGYDTPLANIEVTLYEEDGTLATLAQEKDEDGNITEVRTNPTLTDENGDYIFKGLDSQKKYYVTYKMNGQHLESTMYTAKVEEYNSKNWNKSSMATILDANREEYNKRFEVIESAPNNYKIVNKIFSDIGDYNKTYNIFEQTYEKAQRETDDMTKIQSLIIEKIRNYIDQFNKYPDDLAKRAIYQQIADENSDIIEVKNKIQYIVDMEVIATTGNHTEIQYYPIYDKFVIGNEEVKIGKETYPPIYEGQKHINFGAIEREKADLKLSKDIYLIKVTINGKEYTYRCNRRQDEPKEIELRGSDIDAYQRDLRESDIQFIDHVNYDQRRLRVYITYKIRVTNQSNEEITTYVTGLNDYYDKDYQYLSSNAIRYNENGVESDNQIHWDNDTQNHKLTTTDANISSIPLNAGQYFDVFTEFELSTEAIKRLIDEKESTKENYAEIAGYKTYYTNERVFDNGDVINPAGYVAGLVDRDSRPGDFNLMDSAKRFEVEAFVKYSYTDEFKSKDGETKTQESLNIFQDDADKAPGVKFILLTILREINGNVWEDSVLSNVLKEENIRRGDGINNDNSPIKGMKVELIDMYQEQAVEEEPYKYTNYNKVAEIYDIDGKIFKTAITYTDENGAYQLKGYVPGDYLIRYTYGEGKTLTTDSNGKVYNGQDYKSTLYEEEKHFAGDQNVPNYWYNLENDGKSDAHDNYSLRNSINSNNATMNNHIATVLDYKVANGDVASDATLKELQDRSIMFAETNKLVLEVEYAKKESSYIENVQEYKVNNIDFGIVERPRSELTLVKDVANVRIIANDGTTIFDANEQTANLGWIKPSSDPYSGQHGMIQAYMDENLMHGATIKILYNFTIKNTGERDYSDGNNGIDISFYNTGIPSGQVVKTKASYIVDYVENNLKFSPDSELDIIDKDKLYNQHWVEITDKSELYTGDNNKLIAIDQSIINDYTTIIKATDDSPLLNDLAPANIGKTDGDIASTTLLLTKVLNTESNQDNLTYDNSAEVVQTKNIAGRRSYNNLDADNNDINETVKSIPGNYNPKGAGAITEPDSNKAETITVQVPFGEENKIPFIVGVVLATIVLAGGIFIIKKKVLKK